MVSRANNLSYEERSVIQIDNYPIAHDFFKRLFDLLFSFLILILTLPITLTIALLVLFTSRGGIFYAQERITRGGRIYKAYKFRTMRKDADLLLHKILESDPQKMEEWKTFWKLKNDPRITLIGKFLRKTSLDEFPQFINVIKGDMSVVGPRPVVHKEVVNYFQDKAGKILSVRPGITGLWQVSGRSNLSMKERVLLEEKYVDTRSFLLDLKLICKTLPVVLLFKGAY